MPGSRGSQRARVTLAYAAFVLAGLGVGVAGVLLPAQIADYGVDRATIGITFFTFSAGFMLAGSSAGALIHRFGVRTALLVGAGTFLLAASYTAAGPAFVGLVVAQAAAGYGIGTLESVLNAYLAGLPRATILLNRLHAFFGVGALLGPLLATRLLALLPWTAVWLVLAVATLPLLAGFLVAYPPASRTPARDRMTVEPATTGSDDATARPTQRDRGLFATTLRQPGVLLAAALLAAYVGLEVGVGNWAFSYMVTEREQGDLLAGYAISGYWLGLTAGRFVISPILTRIGMTAIGMTYLCLSGVMAAAVFTWLAPDATSAGLSLIMLGFFLGPIFPTTMAVTPRLTTPQFVPTAIGLMNAGSVIGGSTLPWLAGVITQAVGLWTLFPFAAVLALTQVLLWWRMTHRLRGPATPAPDVPRRRDAAGREQPIADADEQ